VIADFLEEYNN